MDDLEFIEYMERLSKDVRKLSRTVANNIDRLCSLARRGLDLTDASA